MFKTIKSKFIVFAVLFIIISVGVPMHFLVQQFRDNFQQRSQNLLESTLDMLMFSLNNMMMTGDDKNVQSIVEDIGKSRNVDHIRIIASDARILFSSIKTDIGKKIKEVSPEHKFNSAKIIKKRSLELSRDYNSYSALETIFNKRKCQSCHEG